MPLYGAGNKKIRKFLRMNICKRILILSAFSSLLFISVRGEDWSFTDCLQHAKGNNISLQQSRLNEAVADINLEEAKGNWQPSLNFSTSHGYTNSPWGNVKNGYSSAYGLNAGWTAYDGGIRSNTIKRDKLAVQSYSHASADIIRTLETEILQAYINALYARETIEIYKEAASLSKAQMERAKALMDAGRLSRVDYTQLKAQYEQDNYSLVDAQSSYSLRVMELKKILQLGIENDLNPVDINWTAIDFQAPLPPMDESYALALKTDQRLRQLEIEKEMTEYDVKIAKGEKLPKISLNAGVSTGYSAPGGNFGEGLKRGLNENIGLTLSVPILDNKKSNSAIARAQISLLNADLDIKQRNTDLAQLVENWYLDTRSARARYMAAVKQLDSAKLASELTDEQFRLGMVNTIELMTAHRDFTDAAHSLIQAKYLALLGEKMIDFYRTGSVSL